MLTFGNVITAMITPFHEDGSVNYEGAVKLAQYYCENGSDGILIAGTTGEGATMTEDEKLKLFTDISAAVGDKVMVMANVGTNNTAQTIEFMKKAEKTGSFPLSNSLFHCPVADIRAVLHAVKMNLFDSFIGYASRIFDGFA